MKCKWKYFYYNGGKCPDDAVNGDWCKKHDIQCRHWNKCNNHATGDCMENGGQFACCRAICDSHRHCGDSAHR